MEGKTMKQFKVTLKNGDQSIWLHYLPLSKAWLVNAIIKKDVIKITWK